MALSKVPLVPQWNVSNGCVCTPDGGVLYVGSRTINYIGEFDKVPQIKVFQTRQSIQSIDIDPTWPSTAPSTDNEKVLRYFAALGQDNSVQIWDFHKGQVVRGHKAHLNTKQRRYMEGNGPSPTMMQTDRVLLGYMCNRNVLSVDSHDLVIYCVASNTYCQRPMFVTSRGQHMTVLSCSPYNENIFAVGTSRGLVQVCDIQRMCILYSLRGHDSMISSLSWNRMSNRVAKAVNVKPTPSAKHQDPKPTQKPKQLKQQSAISAACDDMFDIYDYEYLENEFGAPTAQSNANKSRALKKSESDDNDFVGLEKPKEAESANKFDFAEACQSLKEDIAALKRSDSDGSAAQCNEVTLVDCQRAKRYDSTSDEEGDDKAKDGNYVDSNESTEGSLELINHSSSSDEVDVDGVERKPKQQVLLHQAEVHASQPVEKNSMPTEEAQSTADATKTEEKPMADKKGTGTKEETIQVEEKSYEDILLLSGAADGSIWIWNSEHGGACDNITARNSSKNAKKLPIEVRWLNSQSFLATNKSGDLNLYTLNNEHSSASHSSIRRYKFKEHSQIFSQRGIVSFCVGREKNLLWCISYNRDIWCQDMAKMSVSAHYCCASSNIATMRECPDDMNKIALGFSDRRLGVIDISKLTPTNVHIETFSQRIDATVLALAWSPDSKRLAFGTTEGRVGIVNVENPKQQIYIFNPVCGKAVYSIAWEGDKIYVVVNEVIAVYDCNSNNKDAIIIPNIKQVSHMLVRKNFLFVGTQSGHLHVYRRSADASKVAYEFLQDLEISTRYITDIAWNPIDPSKFAVAANTNRMQVLSFDVASGVVSPLQKVDVPNAKTTLSCVKWSNRNEKELLTCAFDGSLRVWELQGDTIAEKFSKQFQCPINCGLFLPADEDVLVYCGRSISMEFINRTEPPAADEGSEKLGNNNRFVQENVQWAQKVVARSDSKPGTQSEKRSNRQAKRAEKRKQAKEEANDKDKENVNITNMIGGLKINDVAQEKSANAVAGELAALNSNLSSSHSMKKPLTLLYLTTKELNKDATAKLTFVLESPNWNCNQKNNKVLLSKLFAKKAVVQELLAEELHNHMTSGANGISNILMHQMKNNLKEEIIKCIQSKKLTEWHVSVAPSISYVFWQKCCQAFAEQLMENGCALQAASYMLAIHNETKAIDMLLKDNYHKEALMLARVYLQDDDPLIVLIADKWITHLRDIGNLSGAALICALTAQYNRGYDILIRLRAVTPDVQHCLGLLKSKTADH